uniref:Lipocalin/cytosolic fatty-acid binding domain-containing protein n=1 Tax=Panagrolaimus sp. ES5 TaxID=591445 RepID=A0AC34F1S5_9BILA
MKTCILVKTYISRKCETIVKVNENLEFLIKIPQPCIDNTANYTIQLQKIKGDFEIQRICFYGGECENINKKNNSFVQQSLFIALHHTFYLLIDAEFVEVDSAVYQLEIDSCKIKYLKEFELFRGKIILSNFENKEFKYSVKRNSLDFVEVTVENPDRVRINGQTEDYTFQKSVEEKIVHKLSFIFEKPTNHADETNSLSISTHLSDNLNSNLPQKNAAQNFAGKWDYESSENFDEFLKAIGAGWMTRAISGYLKPQIVFIIDGEFWRIESNSAFQTNVLAFELGEDYEEIGSDGTKTISIFTLVDDGKKLHQVQKGRNSDEKDTIYDRYIENRNLIIEMEYDGIKARRIYTRAAQNF